ncbi:RNA-guided endonuclease InsQ/TnpB family protein [Coleofasciculus sp.]|uniref:RNA-guided endonuclease InsQ/TnpB family protein n=1 Tax=Coleofasciculus sp. TaxID=3100458 RepID=UPI0039F7D309
MYGCQQVLLKPDVELAAILDFICSEANKLTNCGIYYARQLWFKRRWLIGKYDLEKEYKHHLHFQALHSQAAQQVLRSVSESFKSFRELTKAFEEGKIPVYPKLPKYRKKGGLTVVSYPKQALSLKNGLIRIPLGRMVKTWFKLTEFLLPMPSNLEFKEIKELRILPINGCFYAEFVYQLPSVKADVDKNRALGIDPGVNNWLTCVSNIETSFIVDGRKLKSLNQFYNKRVAELKKGKPQGFWNDELASYTEKRNRQMRDAVNKVARRVINYCLIHRIGTIVFGWNQGNKNGIELGKKNNQEFVQIPTSRLKNRIAQLCKQYGIRFVETEESYTSQASFLDNDVLPVFGKKPKGWKSSGKRVKRGMFKTAAGHIINADGNGAANILRKVEIQLGLDLAKVCRALLTAPSRLFIWNSKKIKSPDGVLTRPEVSF